MRGKPPKSKTSRDRHENSPTKTFNWDTFCLQFKEKYTIHDIYIYRYHSISVSAVNILVSAVGILCRVPSFDGGFLQTQHLLFQMDLNHALDMIFKAKKYDMRYSISIGNVVTSFKWRGRTKCMCIFIYHRT